MTRVLLMLFALCVLAHEAVHMHATVVPVVEVTVVASDAAVNDYFGWAVAISGTNALIGAYIDDSAGSAYLFSETAPGVWTQVAKLTAGDAASGDTVRVIRSVCFIVSNMSLFLLCVLPVVIFICVLWFPLSTSLVWVFCRDFRD